MLDGDKNGLTLRLKRTQDLNNNGMKFNKDDLLIVELKLK